MDEEAKLQTVDSMIMAGLKGKFVEQFRCPTTYATGPDKLRELQIIMGNKPIEYPYIFLTIQTDQAGTDTYSSHRLARYGVPTQVSDDQREMQYTRIIPTNFEIEVTFITNKRSGSEDCADFFARRWLFCRRNGFLQFAVKYGLTRLDISSILNETVTIPVRENPADQESVYQVTSNLTVKGYVSEPVVGRRQRILKVDTQIAAASSETQAPQFFPFN